jgi:hypothetical protein
MRDTWKVLLGKSTAFLSGKEKFGTVFAALCHDAGHPGLSNAFQASIQSKLSIRYNDRSATQQNAASTVFKLLRREECKFIKTDFPEFRRWVIEVILWTDSSRLFEALARAETILLNSSEVSLAVGANRLFLSSLVVRASDFGYCAKSITDAENWAQLVH